jgi:chromosome segregation ATPase
MWPFGKKVVVDPLTQIETDAGINCTFGAWVMGLANTLAIRKQTVGQIASQTAQFKTSIEKTKNGFETLKTKTSVQRKALEEALDKIRAQKGSIVADPDPVAETTIDQLNNALVELSEEQVARFEEAESVVADAIEGSEVCEENAENQIADIDPQIERADKVDQTCKTEIKAIEHFEKNLPTFAALTKVSPPKQPKD